MQQPNTIDVLSSGIHDVKNDLFNALSRIEALIAARTHKEALQEEVLELRSTHHLLERSAQRLSELLSTYRVLDHENPVTLLPVFLPDFLSDLLQRVQTVVLGLKTEATATVPAPLHFELMNEVQEHWFFDRELIEDSLFNALQNATRFAHSRVRLSALRHEDFLVLRVEDDGPGYPAIIPGLDDNDAAHTGLFLTRRIAALHQRHARQGYVTLSNDSTLGGALFSLYLP